MHVQTTTCLQVERSNVTSLLLRPKIPLLSRFLQELQYLRCPMNLLAGRSNVTSLSHCPMNLLVEKSSATSLPWYPKYLPVGRSCAKRL